MPVSGVNQIHPLGRSIYSSMSDTSSPLIIYIIHTVGYLTSKFFSKLTPPHLPAGELLPGLHHLLFQCHLCCASLCCRKNMEEINITIFIFHIIFLAFLLSYISMKWIFVSTVVQYSNKSPQWAYVKMCQMICGTIYTQSKTNHCCLIIWWPRRERC